MSFILNKLMGNVYAVAAVAIFAALASLTTWHYVDRAAAVREARLQLTNKVAAEALQARNALLVKRVQLAEKANQELTREVLEAEELTRQTVKEIEDYATLFKVDAACVVDANVLKRLQYR